MKKMYFMCMVLFISLSTTMWTACSDDDDPQKDPTEEPTQPGDSTTVTTPTHDTTFLVTKIVCENVNNPDLGYNNTYTFTRDEDSNQIISIKGDINMSGEGQTIEYTITYTESEVRAVYMDESLGEEMAYVYTLDDQGRVTYAKKIYTSDEYAEAEYSFTYEGENLKTITDAVYEENVFAGEYTDGNLSGVSLEAMLYDPTPIPCKASDLKNNDDMDLNILTIGNMLGIDNTVAFANYLGLIPVTPNLIANFDFSALGEGEMSINYEKAENGSIESITLEGFADITLTTEMEVTEIEAAE